MYVDVIAVDYVGIIVVGVNDFVAFVVRYRW